MNVNKVQPVYNPIDFWHKYRRLAHHLLMKYSRDPFKHEYMETALYERLHNACKQLKPEISVATYIKTVVKNFVRKFFIYGDNKYSKSERENIPLSNVRPRAYYIDTTLDDYLVAQQLSRYINRLDTRQQTIIRMYYGLSPFEDEFNFIEISKILNVTPERCKAIRNQAFKKLRSIFKNKGIYNMEDFINE